MRLFMSNVIAGICRKRDPVGLSRRFLLCFSKSVCATMLVFCFGNVSAVGVPFLEKTGVAIHGFADGRAGIRITEDPNEKDASLAEARVQMDIARMGRWTTWKVRADLLVDEVPEDDEFDLENGTGHVDLREANVLCTPFNFMDVKLGRQILTWGTGDLLFINDMFPKDWQSFFSGKDVEYLKAPSDAIFVSMFPGIINIDVSYTPRFDSDRYINGSRISYWNSMLNARAGRNDVVIPVKRNDWFDDDEIAARLSVNIAGYECAVYTYDGFWKTPQGINQATMTTFFPKLTVYGMSTRSGLGKGLINFECGYYDSKRDSDGTNPFVPNSEARGLVGYERELMKNLSFGLQYYIEHMLNYDDYIDTLSAGQNARNEDRQVVTIRLTRQALGQNLVISFFAYYSPTDEDAYLRPNVKYKVTDAWQVSAGANIFSGRYDHTFFGQFEKNNNIYTAVRYSF